MAKKRLTEAEVKGLVREAFPGEQVLSMEELTEGLCNAAYLIVLDSGRKTVLKIANDNREGFLRNEADLMATELKAMTIVKKSGCVKVPDIYYSDLSKASCTSTYFFMEALDGKSYLSMKDTFSEEERQRMDAEIGKIEREIASIEGGCFGSLVDAGKQFGHLYELVYMLISNVLDDAASKNIIIGVPREDILSLLRKDRVVFDEVKQPVLVHLDLWDGNVFVKDKNIVGIIDWERALWGEALMDEQFRSHNRHSALLKGFGQEEFSATEWRRLYWYDVFLYLTMMTEGAYRGYEDDSQYQWVKPLFDKAWSLLRR